MLKLLPLKWMLKSESYFPSPKTPFMIDCKIDKMRLKNKAVQKVSTVKPPTILVHKRISIALITNKKSPKVSMVTGKVSITNMGLIKILSKPRTTATIKEVVKLAT